MDGHRFDKFAQSLSRRTALKRAGAGGLAAGLAGALGITAAGPGRAAAQDAADGEDAICLLPFEAKVRSGPNAGYETWQAFPNLTVSTVDARTLLAMKCAAARTDVDVEDIRTLAKLLGLRSSDEILRVVLDYFPENRLPVRSRLLLEEIFDDGA